MQAVFMETKGSVGFHAGERERQLGLKAAGEERTHLRAPQSWDLTTNTQLEGHGGRDQPLKRGLDMVTSTGPFWFGES